MNCPYCNSELIVGFLTLNFAEVLPMLVTFSPDDENEKKRCKNSTCKRSSETFFESEAFFCHRCKKAFPAIDF
ncbi:MAG: hypothetical protein IJM19_06415 [Ruminococcus sp.]|nr:hypothetical protein [Ruminococcus sp.]MBR6385062.1 hypothetical protein [Ruminococcus sp.]